MRVAHALGGAPSWGFPSFHIELKTALISFEYKNLTVTLDNHFKSMDYLIMDSGGFTAWTKGKEIDVVAYGEWISEMKEKYSHVKRIEAINLDVITNKTDPKEKILAAVRKGEENRQKLNDMGHQVWPVHHIHDPMEVLDDFYAEAKQSGVIVGIGGTVGTPTKIRQAYFDKVFAKVRADIPLHGLAVTSKHLALRYPWFSVDSSIAQSPRRYGSHPVKGKAVSKVENASRNRPYVERLVYETIEYMHKLELEGTALWKKRGVEWQI
jgi:hypothetical protein